MSAHRARAGSVAIGLLVVVAVVVALTVSILRVSEIEEHTACTVTDKEDRAMASLGDRDPRVYTTCGVFEIADVPLLGHFNAADVYAALQPGSTYDLTTSGWRNGLFSWFPTIIEVTP